MLKGFVPPNSSHGDLFNNIRVFGFSSSSWNYKIWREEGYLQNIKFTLKHGTHAQIDWSKTNVSIQFRRWVYVRWNTLEHRDSHLTSHVWTNGLELNMTSQNRNDKWALRASTTLQDEIQWWWKNATFQKEKRELQTWSYTTLKLKSLMQDNVFITFLNFVSYAILHENFTSKTCATEQVKLKVLDKKGGRNFLNMKYWEY